MNHEGYRDPTADRAVRKADKMPKHIRKIFDALNTVVSVQGIKVTEITDKHTGRKWKLCVIHTRGGDAGGDQKARYETERS